MVGLLYAMKKNYKDVVEMLRNPAKYRQEHPATEQLQQQEKETIVTQQKQEKEQKRLFVLGGVIIALLGISFLSFLYGKGKADNPSDELDPQKLSGLQVAAEFNPNKEVTVVEIHEGGDRNASVSNLGSTLPIISRFNFKDLTKASFQVIGAAPWALTLNISSNIADPDLVNWLLKNSELVTSFLHRPDVEPLLADPNALKNLLTDENLLKDFLADDTLQQVIASEPLAKAVVNSSLTVGLLNSPTGKYFRKNPQEALAIIQSSSSLTALQQNAVVRKVISESRLFKDLAPTLLSVNAKK